MTKKEKTNITKTPSTSDLKKINNQKEGLESRKEALIRLIEGITAADYVELTNKIIDVAGQTQIVYLLTIEKNGNISIRPKRSRLDELHGEEEDDFDD